MNPWHLLPIGNHGQEMHPYLVLFLKNPLKFCGVKISPLRLKLFGSHRNLNLNCSIEKERKIDFLPKNVLHDTPDTYDT